MGYIGSISLKQAWGQNRFDAEIIDTSLNSLLYCMQKNVNLLTGADTQLLKLEIC